MVQNTQIRPCDGSIEVPKEHAADVAYRWQRFESWQFPTTFAELAHHFDL